MRPREADERWAVPAWALRTPGVVPDDDELIQLGGELDPDLVLSAYRHGLFPMGVGRHGGPPMGWWSPNPRGVLLPGALHVSRSLRRSIRRFEVTIDRDFDGVMRGCADPRRSGRWITPAIRRCYAELHRRGHAHSIEVRRDGLLVGGLYGVVVGGLFAGESMFHQVRDASKVALAALADTALPPGEPDRMVDVQWVTEHLASLGIVPIDRTDYLHRLDRAVTLPEPSAFAMPDRRAPVPPGSSA